MKCILLCAKIVGGRVRGVCPGQMQTVEEVGTTLGAGAKRFQASHPFRHLMTPFLPIWAKDFPSYAFSSLQRELENERGSETSGPWVWVNMREPTVGVSNEELWFSELSKDWQSETFPREGCCVPSARDKLRWQSHLESSYTRELGARYTGSGICCAACPSEGTSCVIIVATQFVTISFLP